MASYFFQIHHLHLLSYLSEGLLLPSSAFPYARKDKEGRLDDLQEAFPKALVLTKNKHFVQGKAKKEDSVVLEVILTKEDSSKLLTHPYLECTLRERKPTVKSKNILRRIRRRLQKMERRVRRKAYNTITQKKQKETQRKSFIKELYLFPSLLPISRIKTIHVFSEATKSNLIAQERTSSDIRLPEGLIQLSNDFTDIEIPKGLSYNEQNLPSANTILRYQKLMGLFAYAQHAEKSVNAMENEGKWSSKALFLLNPKLETSPPASVTRPYFSTLLGLDKDILPLAKTLEHIEKMDKGIAFSIKAVQQVVNDVGGLTIPSVKEGLNIAFGRDRSLTKAMSTLDKAMEGLHRDEKNKDKAKEILAYILLIFLEKYGIREGNHREAILINLNASLSGLGTPKRKATRAGFILATLGYFYGYPSIPKVAKGEDGKTFLLKFDLTQKDVGQLIETLYQFCFISQGKPLADSFDFLPKYEAKVSSPSLKAIKHEEQPKINEELQTKVTPKESEAFPIVRNDNKGRTFKIHWHDGKCAVVQQKQKKTSKYLKIKPLQNITEKFPEIPPCNFKLEETIVEGKKYKLVRNNGKLTTELVESQKLL